MKIKLISIVSAMVMLVFGVAAFSTTASAQKPDKAKTIELKSSRASASKGDNTDKNIKQEAMANDPKARHDAPAAKGGKSKGGGCRVQLDNSTEWFIRIYVDGIYRGTMDPWGDNSVYVLPGDTTVYARADFTDGSYRYWGPKVYDCGTNEYINFKMVQ